MFGKRKKNVAYLREVIRVCLAGGVSEIQTEGVTIIFRPDAPDELPEPVDPQQTKENEELPEFRWRRKRPKRDDLDQVRYDDPMDDPSLYGGEVPRITSLGESEEDDEE